MICFTESELQRHEERIIDKALAEQERLIERLKQEAEIHAQEARTANRTIAEIYQVVSGATGEPGNWHGAEPVRQLMAQAIRFAEYYANSGLDVERLREVKAFLNEHQS